MRQIFAAGVLGVVVAAAAPVVLAADKAPKAPASRPTTRPGSGQAVKLDVTKHEEIEAAVDKTVVFTATVDEVRWTKSGKTLLITFKDAPSDFRAISYENYKKDLDKAFGGDVAEHLAGKQVEVRGVLKRYVGSIDAWKGMTQVAITKASQVKIVEEKK